MDSTSRSPLSWAITSSLIKSERSRPHGAIRYAPFLPFAAVRDDEQIQRFKNEPHAAAQLHHQHIVPVRLSDSRIAGGGAWVAVRALW